MSIDNWKASAHGWSLAFAVCIASCLHAFTPAHSAETERTGSAGKPQPVKFQHAHGEKSVRVRTASYNIRCQKKENDNADYWDNRKSDLVKLVKSIAPDVIGFQEVRDNQYKYLRKQFPDYTFVGATRDKTPGAEATPVAFRTKRFALLDSGTFWLSATPKVPGSKAWGNGIEDSGYPRICSWTLLKDRTSGGVFCFASTHLDLKAGPRLAGMKLILSSLARFDAANVPVVVVGDMNALETEGSMLAAAGAMQDSLLVSKTNPTGSWRTFSAFKWKADEVSSKAALSGYSASERSANVSTLGKRIDYIFTSFGTEVESFATRNDARPGKNHYPSDHYPIVADLKMSCPDSLHTETERDIGGATGPRLAARVFHTLNHQQEKERQKV